MDVSKHKYYDRNSVSAFSLRLSTLSWLFLGAFAIVVWPFCLSSPLPLSDYPNHVARMHIIANLANSADLARYYFVEWEFIPNLAMDLLVPLLIPALSAEAASLLFAALSLFMMASGAIVLHRKLYGRWSLVPFLAFFLLYNRHFLWGFLNYLFTVGLGLWVLAAHIHLRQSGRLFRIVLFTVLSLILMVSHLHAFASYAILVGGYELSIAWRNRQNFPWGDLLTSAAQFVLPAILFVTLSSTGRASEIKWSSPMDKLAGMLDMVNNYNLSLDIATFTILFTLVAIGLARRQLSIHRDLRLPLAALFIIYLCLPRLIFASFGADRRLLVMVALVFVAALDIRVESARVRTMLMFSIATLFIARIGVLSVNWNNAQKTYRPILAAIDKLPTGVRVAVICGGDLFPYLQNPPLEHVPNMAVISKNVYMNTLFAEPGKQVLRSVYGSTAPFSVDPSQTFRMDVDQVGKANPFDQVPWDRFDYFMLINPRFFVRDYPAQLKPVYKEGVVVLFKVEHEVKPAPIAARHVSLPKG